MTLSIHSFAKNAMRSILHFSYGKIVMLLLLCQLFSSTSYGQQTPCSVDVQCTTTTYSPSDWEKEIRSTVKIVVDLNRQFVQTFSGVLLNNTRMDNSLYILTAFHNIDYNRDGYLSTTEIDDVKNWEYHFKYYNVTCGDSTTATTPLVLNQAKNAKLVSAWAPSDFALIKLSEVFNPCDITYSLYYAGWDRRAAPFNDPGKVVNLSHPTGEVTPVGVPMKVFVREYSGYFTPKTFSADTMFWSVKGGNTGEVYSGSSGSALFTDNHFVVGQLSSSSIRNGCILDSNFDYTTFGRFDLSWEGGGTPQTQLKAWLYPDFASDPTAYPTLNGMEYLGGDSVGGKLSCTDFDIQVRYPRQGEMCCWDVRILPKNTACFNAVSAKTLTLPTTILSAPQYQGDTLVYQYCPNVGMEGSYPIIVKVMGVNGMEFCTDTFSVSCDTCNCSNGYSLKYRLVKDLNNSGDVCCYIPVVTKIDQNACVVHGMHVFENGQYGVYSTDTLMKNVGDSIELPQVCLNRSIVQNGKHKEKVILYNQPGSHVDGIEPMCKLIATMPACCNCSYGITIVEKQSPTPRQCCYTIRVNKNFGCTVKSMYLYTEQGVYLGVGKTGISIVNDSLTICLDRINLPKNVSLRFFDKNIANPQASADENICQGDFTLPKCELNCCDAFTRTIIADSDLGLGYPYGHYMCLYLKINKNPLYYGIPECDLGKVKVFSLTSGNLVGTYDNGGLPFTYPDTIRTVCCDPYAIYITNPTYIFRYYDMNGKLLPCADTVTLDCGAPGHQKTAPLTIEEPKNPTQNQNVYIVPNPANQQATIHYLVNTPGNYKIKIINNLGIEIESINVSYKEVGAYKHTLNTENMPAGIYYVYYVTPKSTYSTPFTINH